MKWNRKVIKPVGVLIALLISIQVFGAARAQSVSDNSIRKTRAGEILQQPEPPVTHSVERAQLAFPGFRPGGVSTGLFPGRLMSHDFDEWPTMLHIGDSAEVAGKTFTVKEVLLVPGSDRSMAYEPATGRKRFAPEGLRTNLFDFSKNTEVFIPPNSALVMVNIDVDPEAVERPQGQAGCETLGERDYANVIRMSYGNSGEVNIILTDRDENFGIYRSPRVYCLTSGWLYLHVMTLSVDREQLWFELVDEELNHDLAIWNLASVP